MSDEDYEKRRYRFMYYAKEDWRFWNKVHNVLIKHRSSKKLIKEANENMKVHEKNYYDYLDWKGIFI